MLQTETKEGEMPIAYKFLNWIKLYFIRKLYIN